MDGLGGGSGDVEVRNIAFLPDIQPDLPVQATIGQIVDNKSEGWYRSISAAVWADALEQAIATGRADKARITGVIREKGFDSRQFARILCELYENATRE